MSERDRSIMLSDINDTTHIMSKDEYLPINIPNKELLCDTIESNLIDILKNNKKEYNIFANIVICYIKKAKVDEEENETEEEEKEMIEKRKKNQKSQIKIRIFQLHIRLMVKKYIIN